MKKVFLFSFGILALSLAATAQDANGARPKKATATTTTTAEKPATQTTQAVEVVAVPEVDQYGNKKGTPEFEEAKKAEKMTLEEKKKATIVQ